jgi:polyisoprenyl-phosphate glycosyltransferase
MRKCIDIILPVYKEEAVIERFNKTLFESIGPLMTSYEFKVIYVVDRSPDRTFEILRELATRHSNITVLHMARRFGHQVSLAAGIHRSTGDAAIMMDCDLQHPPSLIPELLDYFERGFEIVHTVRSYDDDVPLLKRATSRVFYALQNALSPVAMRDGVADFRLISGRVAKTFRQHLNEHDPFLRGLFQWLGYTAAWVPFKSPVRPAGKTHYSLSRLVLFSIDGILSFSKIPLRIATFGGLCMSVAAALYGLYLLYVYFRVGSLPAGYPSLMLMVLILGGLQLCVLGVIGEYLGRIFDEVKNRPLYVIDEIVEGKQR